MLHIHRFLSSRCRLFHNAIFFGSCNIHILYTECAKILKKITAPKGQKKSYNLGYALFCEVGGSVTLFS